MSRLPSLPALRFGTATSDRVTVAETTPMIDMSAFSVIVWAYVTSYRNIDTFVSKRTTGGAGWHLFVDGTAGRFSFGMTFATTGLLAQSATGVLPLDQWVCLAATTDAGTNTKIYIGSLNSPLAEPSYVLTPPGGGRTTDAGIPLQWGNWNAASRSLSGSLAAGTLVPRILTLPELRAWQQSPHLPIPGALDAKVFGEDGPLRVFDRSQNGNHGTITGAVQSGAPSLPLVLVDDDPPAVRWKRALFALSGSGSLSSTLDAATVSGTGTLAISGALTTTLGAATLSATGALSITGAVTSTLDAATLSGTGTLPITGSATVTLGAATLAGTGSAAGSGVLSVTLGDATVSATGTLPITGAASVTLADATVAGVGTLPIVGALTVTLSAATLSATGTGSDTGTSAAYMAASLFHVADTDEIYFTADTDPIYFTATEG